MIDVTDPIALRAEADRRQQLRTRGVSTFEVPPDPKAIERDKRIREKAEQEAVTKLFRRHGFTVRSTSQARPSKIAIGFPDLFVTHRSRPLAFFWETKRQVGGVVSEAQQEFADDCARCGVRWYTGDRYHAAAFLRAENIPEVP